MSGIQALLACSPAADCTFVPESTYNLAGRLVSRTSSPQRPFYPSRAYLSNAMPLTANSLRTCSPLRASIRPMSQSMVHQPALKILSASTNNRSFSANCDRYADRALHTEHASHQSERGKEPLPSYSRDREDNYGVDGHANALKFGKFYYPWEGLECDSEGRSFSPSLCSETYTEEGVQGWMGASDTGSSQICHPDLGQSRSAALGDQEGCDVMSRGLLTKKTVRNITDGGPRADEWALAVDPKSHKWYYYNRYDGSTMARSTQLRYIIDPPLFCLV